MADAEPKKEAPEQAPVEKKGPTMLAIADSGRHDGLMPVAYSDKYNLAKLLSKSGLIPKSLDTAEKVFIALQMGHEFGLTPMVACNNITAINGKATLSSDLIAALCRRHPDFAGMKIDARPTGCTVTMRRRNAAGDVDEFSYTFDEEAAKKAKLLSKTGPWQEYPQRMYKARAVAYCGRDAFPDMLAGMLSREEAIDLDPEPGERPVAAEEHPVNEELEAARAELKALLERLPEKERDAYLRTMPMLMDAGSVRALAASVQKKLVGKPSPKVEDAQVVPEKPKVDETGQQEIF